MSENRKGIKIIAWIALLSIVLSALGTGILYISSKEEEEKNKNPYTIDQIKNLTGTGN